MASIAALPDQNQMAGPAAPMSPGNGRQDIEYTPDHPQDDDTPELTAQQKLREFISEDDEAKFKTIITNYRTGWAPDRLLRLARWMRNQLMYRGQQILGFDQQQGIWYDALGLYMQSGKQQEGDDTYLQSFQNNVTKMLGTAFVGTMSRSVPPTVIQ